jgi:hypothetical protein
MGCCNRQSKTLAKPTLPVIQPKKAKAATAKSPTRKREKPLPRIVQDHCVVCGETWKFHPAYVHACKGERPVKYQQHRKEICTDCKHNRDGVCMPLKTIMRVRKPDENPPCLAEVSWNQPAWKCPIDRWERCLFRCNKCGSQTFDENGLKTCPVCHPRSQPKPLEMLPAFIASKSEPPYLDGPLPIAVTSLALRPLYLERQTVCLDSWKALGFHIVAVHLPHSDARKLYPQVDEWIEEPNYPLFTRGSYGEKPTVRIHSLFNVATQKQSPVMVINSDIEISDTVQIRDAVARREVGVGIRKNHKPGMKSEAKIFSLGLDAFIVHPEHIADLPNLQFGLGKGMWDYWIPAHFRSTRTPMRFIAGPFYHQEHPQQWTLDDWRMGVSWIRSHYGPQAFPEKERASLAWRQLLPYGP